jgi:hypothetical protein
MKGFILMSFSALSGILKVGIICALFVTLMSCNPGADTKDKVTLTDGGTDGSGYRVLYFDAPGQEFGGRPTSRAVVTVYSDRLTIRAQPSSTDLFTYQTTDIKFRIYIKLGYVNESNDLPQLIDNKTGSVVTVTGDTTATLASFDADNPTPESRHEWRISKNNYQLIIN